jgi:hypothetical protein
VLAPWCLSAYDGRSLTEGAPTFLSQPVPLPIVLCDSVHLDPVTKRKTLLGVYPHVVGVVVSGVRGA